MRYFDAICFLSLLVGITKAGILMSAQNEEAIIRRACIERCAVPQIPGSSVCTIAHPTDCFKFVVCTPFTGSMYIQVMPCAFGTMAIAAGFEAICGRADLVMCTHDECLIPNTTVYNHDDANCRTHWQCVQGRSEPACCARYHRFVPELGQCERDRTCDASCPLLNDATCNGQGVTSLNIPDDNCKTYWKCVDHQPVPTCCKDGMGYDIFQSACVVNASCIDTCPQAYQENCSLPNIDAYKMNKTNCRTYMKCSKLIPGLAEPYCCRSGMMFDEPSRRCVDAGTLECINTPCPTGYREECRLESVPGMPSRYKNLDAFGGNVMPCPVGTVFNPAKCQCNVDPTQLPSMPTPGLCEVAIHAMLPNLKNLGSVLAALLMVGKYGQGEKGVGNMTAFWDGDDGINIPYFGSQAPNKLYIEITFTPTERTSQKQILVTSCEPIGKGQSFEISLVAYQNKTGVLTTRLATPGLGLGTIIEMPYQINKEYTYRMLYDGTKLGVILIPRGGTPMSNSQAFSGNIPIHRSGLRFTKCRYKSGISGFTGYVSEIKVSKCLTQEMQQELAMLTPAV